ncbi:RDD family protein [Anaerotignum neopropionicum]|uniref:RDD family protein n=1 Tax=Anaerotignum neopropionicum TaxID=36847 RepID=A0A136WEH9_9FIRM|nr:RDD family protein [Anaerotignum neopropionicum]KXL52904.1 RDD family protein [Anaerotignum neopropionicum]
MTKEEMSAAYGVELETISRFRNNGLVTPKRMEDGSWVYCEADGEKLQRLMLLEKMGFSENNFVMLSAGDRTLKALLQRRFDGLEDGCLGKEICRQILEEGADLESFDAKKYLDQLGTSALDQIFSCKPEFQNQVYRPWRRYFARMTDVGIYNFIWDFFLGFILHVNLSHEGYLWQIIGAVITVALMLFIEPLLLNRFGTTFGKWVFGLRVEKAHGAHLTYAEGLKRTWVVVGKGTGYWIPIYNLVRLYKSYKVCKAEETQPWDGDISYTIKDTKWYRVAACIVLHGIFIFIAIIMMQFQQLPPNRGDITMEEFAQNYNYFCKYLDVNQGSYMDKNGQLVEKPSKATISIDLLDGEPPKLEYEIENGYLTGVSFVYEVENKEHFTEIENIEKSLIVLAFGCTDKEVGLFMNSGGLILKDVIYDDDVNFTVGDCRYYSNVQRVGYKGHSLLIPDEGAKTAYYKMEFSVTKEK